MSDNYAISLKRTTALMAAITFLSVITVFNLSSVFSNKVGAAQLESRSLTLSSTLDGSKNVGTAGSETNGAAAHHTFEFTASAGATSATFTYCTTAIGGCTAPTGLVLPANPGASSGTTSAASNVLTWTDTISGGANSVTFGTTSGITNPTSAGSFFVRIQTIAAGPVNVDEGTVASAITAGIEITSRVAETLGFSTTGDFGGVGAPGSTCAALTGSGAITLGDPTEQTLSISSTYDNYSAFRIYTNSANGVNIQYEGDTLRRTPSSVISHMPTKAGSVPASEQFGLAVDSVSTGSVSTASRSATISFANVDQAAALANVPDGPLTIASDYDTGSGTITSGGTARFAYVVGTPTTIASTAGFTNCKTVAVRYIANISPLTPAGTYRTTVVYSAVPTY
ncbi:hypothetical protein KC867_00200 [Candidatus Saccharibacteria bacterium]|nr:hypothetical protein [Candidatus Saccharibacteria bacterium]